MSTVAERKREYKYTAVCERHFSQELGEYESYGIEITKDGARICLVSDISTDKAEVESLAATCDREELSPIHIYDVVEDFLGR